MQCQIADARGPVFSAFLQRTEPLFLHRYRSRFPGIFKAPTVTNVSAGTGGDAMDPEKWRRVKEVFDGALACDSEAQSRYIAEACQGDPDILNEVEALLHHHRQANSQFLNHAELGPRETASIVEADLPSSR